MKNRLQIIVMILVILVSSQFRHTTWRTHHDLWRGSLVTSAYAQLASLQESQNVKSHLRVAIIQDTASLSARINGPYEIVDSVSGSILSNGRNLNATVIAYGDGILIGDLTCNTSKVFIKSPEGDPIIIDARQFRGNIQLVKKDNLRLAVINYIELEDYIKGVLYHEVSHYWPMEALKAQAIVCRTFAIYQAQENASREYDVTADTYSQVYGGRTSERYRTNEAADETRGEVLMYDGKILPAYYHSSCGSRTEDASLLWKISIPPLKGVHCGFCNDSPHFKWHYVIPKDTVQEKLKESGYDTGNIKNISTPVRDESGRVTNLKITGDKNEIEISAKDFRNILGSNVIRSTNFDVNLADGDLVFEGFGWGHGVGMCQWGAYFMAKRGYKYDEILKYYYPGVQIVSF